MQTLRFEDQVALLYSQRGNRIEREVKRSEGISDLFVLSSKGEKWIVRCVNLSEVDSSIAYDLIQLMQSEKAQQGSIITRGIINSSVAQLVKGRPIHLVDGKKLQDYLDQLQLQPQPQHGTQTTQSTLKRFVEAKPGTTETPPSQVTPLRPYNDQTTVAVVAPNLSTSESAASSLKPCPYCAEMIQQAAIVCRFCGRDLRAGQVPLPSTTDTRPEFLLDQVGFNKKIRERTRQGWIIIDRTNDSAQLKKPRQWSRMGLMVFVVLPLLCGITLYLPLIGFALVGFLIVIVDYLLRKDEFVYITAERVGDNPYTADANSGMA